MNKAYPKRINHKYYKDKINVDWLLEPGHINFEAGIGCRLKCGGCMMRFHMSPKAMEYESQAWDCRYNISFDSYKVVFDVFKNFQFIGNLSDPIYHPDFIKTLKYMKGKEIGAKFHTNGSGKTKKWWTEVYKLSQGENWKWIFGLDGLPKDSHIYRINQNGEQVWEMMKLGRSMGATIDWQWIVFKYNQYDIDEGKLMAARYDINFLEMHSTRWVDDRKNGGVDMSIYKPAEQHVTLRRIQRHEFNIGKKAYSNPEIDPDCLNTKVRKPIMFNSLGYFIPCCEKDQWVESMKNRGFYQEKFHIDNLHTADDIRNVFLSDTWQDFYMGLYNNPENAPKNCKSFCVKNTNVKIDGVGIDPKGFV